MNYDLDMPPYIQQMADWLDSDAQPHPCRFENAYAGFEIMMAFCRSVIDRGQVALPLTDPRDELEELKQALPEAKVLFGAPDHAKEYGG